MNKSVLVSRLLEWSVYGHFSKAHAIPSPGAWLEAPRLDSAALSLTALSFKLLYKNKVINKEVWALLDPSYLDLAPFCLDSIYAQSLVLHFTRTDKSVTVANRPKTQT